ncbi:MAG: glycerate kinase type-2 family protein [Candidatus Heimdallarchaeaceae archaeon]
MFVKNRSELEDLGRSEKEIEAINELVEIAEFILNEAQPSKMMSSSLTISNEKLTINDNSYDLNQYNNFYLIAFGKASQTMSKFLLDKFPKNFSRVIIVSPDNSDQFFETMENLTFFQGGHPKPTEQSVKAAESVVSLLEKTTMDDLCIFLISGGGSALLEQPADGISFSDSEELVELLLSSNASIQEINAIRKHFSRIKGGKLAQITKANIVSIILSDVIGNDVSSIASGPTAPDETTWNRCKEIFSTYSLFDLLPESISNTLTKGLNSELLDTPSDGELFKHVQNYIIGDNTKLLQNINSYLNSKGSSEIIRDSVIGESSVVGKEFALQVLQKIGSKILPPLRYLIFGGETTVTLKSLGGIGGRNQELALSFALFSKGSPSLYFLSLGTDGMDGNSKAAGALVGPFTLDDKTKIDEANNSLENNDTNTFFKKYGGELVTGYTGTNLMDIGIIVYYPED